MSTPTSFERPNTLSKLVAKNTKVKTNLKSKVFQYTGAEKPSFHLATFEVANFLNCPGCGKRFTTVNPKKTWQPAIKHEINEDFSTQTFEAICFKCRKEWRFNLFSSWMDNAFDVSFTVAEISDFNAEAEQVKEQSGE